MDLDPTLLTWLFVAGGVLLMLLETVLPGGVAFFLGLGGLVIGALRAVGLVIDPVIAFFGWVFLSTALTIALRPVALRYFGGSASVGLTDEDADAIGQTVTVVQPMDEETTGRIRFRGATWDARPLDGQLPEGATAKILYRDNLTWIVEAADHADLDAELAEAVEARSADSDAAPSPDSSSSDTLDYDPSAPVSSNDDRTPPARDRS
jgi:membrane protein implicated in regulation of membrane protease activity